MSETRHVVNDKVCKVPSRALSTLIRMSNFLVSTGSKVLAMCLPNRRSSALWSMARRSFSCRHTPLPIRAQARPSPSFAQSARRQAGPRRQSGPEHQEIEQVQQPRHGDVMVYRPAAVLLSLRRTQQIWRTAACPTTTTESWARGRHYWHPCQHGRRIHDAFFNHQAVAICGNLRCSNFPRSRVKRLPQVPRRHGKP